MPRGPSPGLGGHLLGDKNTPSRGRHARGGGGHVAVLAVPLPQRLFGRRPQETPGLDRARQSAGAAVGQGLDAQRRRHGGGRRLLRRGPHRPPRRQLRRHGGGPEHRQEEHRHADRVRDQPRPPVPGRRGHPRPDHGDCQRRHPHALRHGQGHRPGGRRRGDRHGRADGRRLHPLRLLRERARLRPRHRHHRPGTAGNGHRRVVYAAAGESVHRLAGDADRHSLPPGARLRGGAARPDRFVDPPGLRRQRS